MMKFLLKKQHGSRAFSTIFTTQKKNALSQTIARPRGASAVNDGVKLL